MRSLASTPGNAFVIPISSTIGVPVSVRAFTVVRSVCWKSEPPAVVGKAPPRADALGSVSYLSSFWTSPALWVTGILIVPAAIFAFAACIAAQTEAGMYFECSSEMPPFERLRL